MQVLGYHVNLSCHFILLEVCVFYLRGLVDRTAASYGSKEVHRAFLLRSLFTVLNFPNTLMGNYAVCYRSSIDSKGTGFVFGEGCTQKMTILLEHRWLFCCCFHMVGLSPPPFPALT